MKQFSNIKIVESGQITGSRGEYGFSASLPLLLIRYAWFYGSVDARVQIECLADGFGPGAGTHGDWSGIRDSTSEAKDAMLEVALNELLPKEV